MKKKITMIALAALTAVSAGAQTIYNGVDFTQKDLNGTARFVGMGGAMGALGGDISTIGTNPAGIGIYRSNDAMMTFGYSSIGAESRYGDKTVNSDKNRGSFDNIGFVLSTKIGNATSLRYVNFGFNYQKGKSFVGNKAMEGLINLTSSGDVVSQTYQMASQADALFRYGFGIDALGKDNNIFDNNNIGWLTALGWDGYLYGKNFDDEGKFAGYGAYLPQPYSKFRSREKGGVDQYDFNVAFNFNDRFYLGLTVGAYDLNYQKYSLYDEDYGASEGYSLENWTNIDGSGFDIKLGAIVRPFESSPLRIGLAIHTPTFYKMTLSTRARVVSDIAGVDENGQEGVFRATVDSYDYLDGRYMETDFQLNTPWKYNVSLGYTVGSNLALGAEYEYQDYSSMRFFYPEGDAMDYENSTANDMLKGIHTLRMGAEYKVIPQFALRAGYNYSTSAYNNEAYKDLPANSIMTDTDYANAKSKSNYTLGIGYRGSMFYADLSYQYSAYKSDFYAFRDEALHKTNVTNTRSQALLTLGIRF